MKTDKQDICLIVRQIADILMINGGFSGNPGLYAGEMGLVLFFARYARYTHNDLYMDYCFDLTEKIQQSIHQDTPVNYREGLTGVGSTIEYLVQNGFFEADTDEILEDVDKRIFYAFNLSYLPVDEIIDVWHYVHWRLSGNSAQKDMMRQTILPQIEKAMFRHAVDPATLQFNRKKIPDGFEEKKYGICRDLITKNVFWNQELGFQYGLAGWGLSLLTEIDDDHSWFRLLPPNRKDAITCISAN